MCARSVPKAALARPLPTRQTRQKGRLNFLYPILLIGIAVKNSILLVDYAVMAEEKGMTRHEALMDACHKRARPVIMTTLAMGAGMMPIALGLTADSSFRMPMAVAVIGGLITSTVLSLVVVPAAYTLVDDLEERVLGKLRRKAADASEVAAPP
ncbi:MAG: efflux RND transporter permease subunit [Rhodocyclaceae bacterium]|nr:efflux RND transporter permease subunit [Rhodocyclaceae bacterium]MCB2025926.1 efflux RND transporter permease subunit [Ottowia sp.]